MCIDWVDEKCKTWGRQMRRVLGSDSGAWPSSSILARIREFQDGAGAPTERKQHFAEVLTGDALDVRRAMEGMPHHLRCVLRVHYIAKARTKQKVPILEELTGDRISTSNYWAMINRAHYFLSARIAAPATE